MLPPTIFQKMDLEVFNQYDATLSTSEAMCWYDPFDSDCTLYLNFNLKSSGKDTAIATLLNEDNVEICVCDRDGIWNAASCNENRHFVMSVDMQIDDSLDVTPIFPFAVGVRLDSTVPSPYDFDDDDKIGPYRYNLLLRELDNTGKRLADKIITEGISFSIWGFVNLQDKKIHVYAFKSEIQPEWIDTGAFHEIVTAGNEQKLIMLLDNYSLLAQRPDDNAFSLISAIEQLFGLCPLIAMDRWSSILRLLMQGNDFDPVTLVMLSKLTMQRIMSKHDFSMAESYFNDGDFDAIIEALVMYPDESYRELSEILASYLRKNNYFESSRLWRKFANFSSQQKYSVLTHTMKCVCQLESA